MEDRLELQREEVASPTSNDLLFDLKTLHAKLQNEHFSLLKSYESMENRLRVSKVMSWYWRWKFEDQRAVSENSNWNEALQKQLERMEALYLSEKRLADIWRNVREKEAKDKVNKYWKALRHRWTKNGGEISEPSRKLDFNRDKSSFPSLVQNDGICGQFWTDFKDRWTRGARNEEPDHALNLYRIAVSNGQDTRVFIWDHTSMKSMRDMADQTKGHYDLIIFHTGSPVKDIIPNSDIKNKVERLNIPFSLQLVLEDGSVKVISSFHNDSKEHENADESKGVKTGDAKVIGKQPESSKETEFESTKSLVESGKDVYLTKVETSHRASVNSVASETKATPPPYQPLNRRKLPQSKAVHAAWSTTNALDRTREEDLELKECEANPNLEIKKSPKEHGRQTEIPISRNDEEQLFLQTVVYPDGKGEAKWVTADELAPFGGSLWRKGDGGSLHHETETTKEKRGEATSNYKKRLMRKPCFDKPSEENRDLIVKKGEEALALANGTVRETYQERRMKEIETTRKRLETREDEIRKQRLLLRELRQTKQALRKHLRKAGEILQGLRRGRQRLDKQKFQLRHNWNSLKKAKGKLDAERKQHEKSKDDVKQLIVQLKTEKERLKKWHIEEEEKLKTSLAKEIKKLEKDKRKFEKKKANEVQQKKRELSEERKRLKESYKELRSLKKAAKKEYKKWLKELQRVKVNSKPSYERSKLDKKGEPRKEYDRIKHRERDKEKEKGKAEKAGEIVQSKAPSECEKCRKTENVKKKSESGEKGKAAKSTNVNKELTLEEQQQQDYRKQLQRLQQWLLQIEEQKLDQEQLRREEKSKNFEKTLGQLQKHRAKASTEQWNKKPKKNAVQLETSKAVAGFTNFSLNFDTSQNQVKELEDKHTGHEFTSSSQLKKLSRKTNNPEAFAKLVEPGNSYKEHKPVGQRSRFTTRLELLLPRKSPFSFETGRRVKHGARQEASWDSSGRKENLADGDPKELAPKGPIPPDGLRGRYEHSRVYSEDFAKRWLNQEIKQDFCSSHVKKPPDRPIPPDGIRFLHELHGRGQHEHEAWPFVNSYVSGKDGSWYMRRARERDFRRKSSGCTDKLRKSSRRRSYDGSWIFGRASDRADQRFNKEPWYARRAEGRKERRTEHQDTWTLERGYYRHILRSLSRWHDSWFVKGPTKRRGCWAP